MAEYSQAGLLAALLLFTALTVRDVYLGRSSPQRGQQPADRQGLSPDTLADTEPGRPAKASLYSGPVLKFQYCKVFQDYSQAISQVYPDIRIQGENYPPTPLNSLDLESGQQGTCTSITAVAVATDAPCCLPWQQADPITVSAVCQIFSCLMAFFLCNMMETQFLSTGAFEVTLNDVPVWSKLQSGYVPNIQEMFQILDNHLKMNQVDHMTFSST
uniref:Selenoprotein T n=1 Tax=Stegastes partitus TaxID=144197 RepID=A0A3B5B5Y8_9TELE